MCIRDRWAQWSHQQAAQTAELRQEWNAWQQLHHPAPLVGTPTEEQVRQLVAQEVAQARRGPAYCRAAGSAVYHGIASAHPLLPVELHETHCGWMFGLVKEVARFDEPPTHLRHKAGNLSLPVGPCKKCWGPEEAAVAP